MSKEPEFFKYCTKPTRKKGLKSILTMILLIIISVGLGVLLYLGMQKIEMNRNPKKVGVPVPEATNTPQSTIEPTQVPTKEPELIKDPNKVTGELSEGALTLLENNTRTPVKVKGIYVTGPKAGSNGMENLIKLVEDTDLNAMVIDIKNDSGEITYNMELDMVKELKAVKPYIKDIKGLVKELKEKNIYLIARIVAFKDPILAQKKPEYSIYNKDGSIFKDKEGLAWVNPYHTEVWKYLVDIAKEAAVLGFDEIQFDYIRFSTDNGMKKVDFGKHAKGKTKQDAINGFTSYAMEQLMPLGVFVSADVYGAIINSKVDAEIVGQDYTQMARNIDYICPMIYPSHYADGAYGVKYPDTEPYKIIKAALDDSVELLDKDKEIKHQAIVRPWLQDFTATWLSNYISYEEKEVRSQIQALYDAGYEEWILWNGSNNYTKEALIERNE